MPEQVEDFYRRRLSMVPPAGLNQVYATAPPEVADLLYLPSTDPTAPPSLEWAMAEADDSPWPFEPGFVPLMGVDEESFACVVATPEGKRPGPHHGAVVRWHLTTDRAEHQRAILDTSVASYVESVGAELRARAEGFDRMVDEIGPAYELGYLNREKRPRDFVVRPVRLACQNVIVGLAAFCQDATIDALSVLAWQTCEVPHVATHEANRAMTVLMLSDAFKNGGTMEVRFDRPAEIQSVETEDGRTIGPFRYAGHPEGRVPASLRRYARTVGVAVGGHDPSAISPEEARELFLAATPMPVELRRRVEDAVARGVASPERLCFTLSAQLWREIELDFMLGVSDRTKSILEGGSAWVLRGDRQAEALIARAARMLGMLFRRLDTRDTAAAGDEARVVEDSRVGVWWTVLDDCGAVLLGGLAAGPLPWTTDRNALLADGESLVVVPRSAPTAADVELVRSMHGPGVTAVLVVPGDSHNPAAREVDGIGCADIVVLECPERLGELDQAIEAVLLKSRTTRR